MDNLKREEKELFQIISQEFIQKITHSRKINIGIFQAMQLLAEKANLWELKMVLLIAQKQPITTEVIFNKLKPLVSKSSVYRKISEYVQNDILKKNPDTTIQLRENFQSISIVGELYAMLKNQKKNE